MDIHISRKGEQFGPYPEAVARQYLQDGTLAATDLAWHAGADGWKPLGELLGIAAQPPAEPTPPPEPQPPPEPTPPPSPATSGPPPATPASSGLPATPSTSGPPPSTPAGDSAAAAASDADEIHIKRKGQQVVTMKRPKAMENFTAGKLVPTDWAWHDGMEEWKPIWEVLGGDVSGGAASVAQPVGAAGGVMAMGAGGAWSIGDCLGEGWQAVKGNLGGVILFALVSSIVLSIAMMLPLINLFLVGPLFGGLAIYYLKLVRRQPAAIGDLFAGFQTYGQLLLLTVFMVLIYIVGIVPGTAVIAISAAPFFKALGDLANVTSPSDLSKAGETLISALKQAGVGASVGVFLIGLIPQILYSFVIFAFPLVVDKRMKALDAIKGSMRLVKGQWLKMILFLFVVVIVSYLGIILCAVGMLITMPIGLAALASCYVRNVK